MTEKYSKVAVILHWIMAIAIIMMTMSGFLFSDIIEDKELAHTMFEWHKLFGIILLLAFFIRITVRLCKGVPELPSNISILQQKLAKLGHLFLYFFMIAMPVTGMLMVYGTSELIIDFLSYFSAESISEKQVRSFGNKMHYLFALALISTVILHILAVIKHFIIDKVNLIRRVSF